MIKFLTSLISPVTSIADKMIMDKDAYAELQFKKIELEHEARKQLLAITTTPRIDAMVKLLLALRDVVIPMFRPLGSIAMAVFGAYCLKNSIELSPMIEAALFGAPLAWGASRHSVKSKLAKAKDPDHFRDY